MEEIRYLEPEEVKSWKRWTMSLYILYLLAAPTLGVSAVAAIFLNYIKVHQTEDTIYEHHFRWQIKTFWVGLMGLLTGLITIFFAIGLVILGLISIWVVYRVVWGMYRLSKNKSTYTIV